MSISQMRQRSANNNCGCSGGTRCQCDSSQTPFETSFSRPNFFAGQMLTDEDLRDAMNYMVQKNRLHNRHLFGEGVVCGLQVDPHPCPEDRHKVIVRKGHAINGCGDDIVAPRDQELDIVKMAYELLQRNRGYGCDDPCRDRQFAESDIPQLRKELAELNIQRQLTMDRTEIANLEKRITELKKSLKSSILQATPVKYGLYVRYTERQSDFVTPYQNDPCTTTRCQGSRIREGYEFELRCHTPSKFPSLREAIDACGDTLPDYEKLQALTIHGMSTLETVRRTKNQFRYFESLFTAPELGEVPFSSFDEKEIANLVVLPKKELNDGSLKAAKRSDVHGLVFDSIAGWTKDRTGADPDVDKPFSKIDEKVDVELKKLEFLPKAFRDLSTDEKKDLLQDAWETYVGPSFSFRKASLRFIATICVENNRRLLKEALETSITAAAKEFDDIAAETSPEKPISEIVKQRGAFQAAHAFLSLACRKLVLSPGDEIVIDQTVTILNEKLSKLRYVVAAKPGEPRPVPADAIGLLVERLSLFKSDSDKRSFNSVSSVAGEIISEGICLKALQNLQAVSKRLQAYVAAGSVSISQELLFQLYRVNLGTFGPESLIDDSQFENIQQQARIVSRAVAEVGKECMCRALLPPCPIDSDTSVLLADIVVDACEVIDICNLSRRVVVSGPALRYWFSDFNGIIADLRDSCCPSTKVLEDRLREELIRVDSSVVSKQFAPGQVASVVKTVGTEDDYLDRLKKWNDLLLNDSDFASQIAVQPSQVASDLISLIAGGNVEPSVLNRVLAQLAGRTDTDLRNVLAWSESFSTPFDVAEIARKASKAAEEVKLKFGDADLSQLPQISIIGDKVKGLLESEIVTGKTLLELVREQLGSEIEGKPMRQFIESQLVEKVTTTKNLKELVEEQLKDPVGGKSLREFIVDQLDEQLPTSGKKLRELVVQQLDTKIENEFLRQFIDAQLASDLHGAKTLRDFVESQLSLSGDSLKKWLKDNVIANISWKDFRDKLKADL